MSLEQAPTQIGASSDAGLEVKTENSQGPQQSSVAGTEAEKSEPKSLLDTVTDALNKQRDGAEKVGEASAQGSSPDSAGGAGEVKPEAAEGEQQADAKDGDGDVKPGSKAEKRIRTLVAERDGFKDGAERWGQFSTWARESGLDAQELTNTLALARMVKQQPFEALAVLRNIVGELESTTGHVIPDDLKDKVERGLIDEQTAQELSVTRSRVKATEAQRAADAERMAGERDANERVELAKSIGTAVTTFERGLEANDPDYQKIKGFVKSRVVELMQTEGVPTSAEGAVAQVKQALKEVKDSMTPFVGERKQTKQLPPSGSNNDTAATPRNALEAVNMALAGRKPRYT